jgi:hypothetical protein
LRESLTVFGFGSFFTCIGHANDIDLLLMHRSTDLESCLFATKCKSQIKSVLPLADIVMLSNAEAEGLNFLERSCCVPLATLTSDESHVQILKLSKILSEPKFKEILSRKNSFVDANRQYSLCKINLLQGENREQ